jgi:hypothetical protein
MKILRKSQSECTYGIDQVPNRIRNTCFFLILWNPIVKVI